MRFAYIDSQGKEVGIPSVEALQLRIELGAIGEETMFFDGSTDRWAPAKDHEIFRTLSRELEEKDDGGFVAPPPPTMLGRAPEEPEDDAPPDFELDLVDDLSPDAAAGDGPAMEEEPAEPAGGEDFDFGDLGTLDLEAFPGEEPERAPEVPEPGDSGLELEPPLSEYGLASEADAGDAGDPGDTGDPGNTDDPGDGGLERLELEDPATAAWSGAEAAPDDPGPWMDQTAGADVAGEAGGGLPDQPDPEDGGVEAVRTPGVGEAGPTDETPPRGERSPDRPSGARRRGERPTHLRRRRKSPTGGVVVGVLAIAALGVAGWLGWDAMRDRGGGAAATGDAVVELPVLPDRLRPSFEAAVAPAWAAAVDSLGTLGASLPEAPDEAWLSGNYLANASSFASVPEYWTAVRGYLERLRTEDEAAFMAAFRERLDSLGVAADDREALVARARAGFQASEPERGVVYGQLEALVGASLDLHDFLVGNEDAIEYEPAVAGLSRDPVTEAVPATEALGEQMWDQVAEITTALDALGALDRVTTDRLLEIVLVKLEATTVR